MVKEDVDDEKEEKVEKPTKKPSLVDDAYKAAERLEKANKEQEALLKRMEQLEARKALGGNASAGQQAPPPKEETPLEYAQRMLRGG